MAELVIQDTITKGSYEVKNIDEIKSTVLAINEKYSKLVITKDSYDEGKKIRASLNKLSDSINDKKKEAKKQILSQFESAERQLKELINIIDKTSNSIDKQLKEIDESDNAEKYKLINIEYEKICDSLNVRMFALEPMFDSRWYNKGMTLPAISKRINDNLIQMQNELSTLANIYTNSEDLEIAKSVYLKNYELKTKELLGVTIKEVNSFISKRKEVQERNNQDDVKECVVARYIVSETPQRLKDLSLFLKANGYRYKVEKA